MLPAYGREYGLTVCHEKRNGGASKKLSKFAGFLWMMPHMFSKNLWHLLLPLSLSVPFSLSIMLSHQGSFLH
jgi:hypothetical protein